jgi:DNA modification methylase
MTGAERIARHRAMRLRDRAALPVNQIVCGHARDVMAAWPSKSVDAIICSPPYFDLVEYEGGLPWKSYEEFLDDMMGVWVECARVLRPNGKLAIVVMMVPVKQAREAKRRKEPRQLHDLAHDFQRMIPAGTGLRLFEKFVWAKQTSERMQGAYPTPGNNLACNTTETITVYVKPGARKSYGPVIRGANGTKCAERLAEHSDLTQQVWWMMPAKINRKRAGGHQAPFPELLPSRLIKLFTFGAVASAGFEGEIVCDPFAGTGTTCVAAKRMGRRWIGIERVESYAAEARANVARAEADGSMDLRIGTHWRPR